MADLSTFIAGGTSGLLATGTPLGAVVGGLGGMFGGGGAGRDIKRAMRSFERGAASIREAEAISTARSFMEQTATLSPREYERLRFQAAERESVSTMRKFVLAAALVFGLYAISRARA